MDIFRPYNGHVRTNNSLYRDNPKRNRPLYEGRNYIISPFNYIIPRGDE